MNTTKHTPGPWINDETEICALVDRENSDTYVAPIAILDDEWAPEIVQANARLIAAAPDLLDALEWAEDELASYAPDPNCRSEITQTILTKVRTAIAKATTTGD